MKNLRTLITICLLFTAVSMFAQTEGRLLVISQIPFDFTVADHIMPAGEYLIYTATPDRSILISSADGKHHLFVNTLPNQTNAPSEKSSLMFQRYGSEYFLTQVWVANQQVVRSPFVSNRQVQLARSGSKPEKTTVAALSGR